MKYLTVDGMLSGTGVRDSIDGGYVDPQGLSLPDEVVEQIKKWLARYEEAHYMGFCDGGEIERLDQEGIAICKILQFALPDAKIDYFSHALGRKMMIF